jgi:hypothetical protein
MMKKIPLFLQIAKWRMLSLFRSYFDKLQSRVVLISAISLCMIQPISLAAYYRQLSSLEDIGSWMVVLFIGIGLISIHGKTHPETFKTSSFHFPEKSC